MATFGPEAVTPARRRTDLAQGTVSWLDRPGAGAPVLLLHGWGSSAASFSGLMRLSRSPRPLLALDLPGFGQSPRGGRDWSSSAYASLISEFLGALDIGECSLLGHSYGGQVSIRLAAEGRLQLDRLMLVAAAGIRPQREGSQAPGPSLYRLLKWCSTKLLPPPLSGAALERLRRNFGSADYREAGEMRPTLVAAVQEDLSGLAQKISVPTLVLWGALDQELPLDPSAARLRERIKGAELVVLEGSGHFPFVDEPARFAAIFDAFMDAQL